MAKELSFHAEAAAEYDRVFAHVTRYFMPFLLCAAGVTDGMRVLALNIFVTADDGQALSFPDGSFDVVLCNLGLMFFPDPVEGCPSSAACSAPAGAPQCRSIPWWSAPITIRSTS
jgi:hypothetical protein